MKFPNFLSIEPRPFDQDHYEDEFDEDDLLDEEGRARLKLRVCALGLCCDCSILQISKCLKCRAFNVYDCFSKPTSNEPFNFKNYFDVRPKF